MFSPTRLLRPDKIIFTKDSLEVDRKRWLGLVSNQEVIKYKNIASVRLTTSLGEGKLTVETQGGAKSDFLIDKLWTSTAKKVRDEIMNRCEV